MSRRLTFGVPVTQDEHPVPIYDRIESRAPDPGASLAACRKEIRTIARAALTQWRRLTPLSRRGSREAFFVPLYGFLREAWTAAARENAGAAFQPVANGRTISPTVVGAQSQWLLGLAREQLERIRRLAPPPIR